MLRIFRGPSVLLLSLGAMTSCSHLRQDYPTAYFSLPNKVIEWTDGGKTRIFKVRNGSLSESRTLDGLFLYQNNELVKITWPRNVPQSRANVFGVSPSSRIVMVIRDSQKAGSMAFMVFSDGSIGKIPRSVTTDGLMAAFEFNAETGFVYIDHVHWVNMKGESRKVTHHKLSGEIGPATISDARRQYCISTNEKAMTYTFFGEKVKSWVQTGKPNVAGFSRRKDQFFTMNNGGFVFLESGKILRPDQDLTVLRYGVTDELDFEIGLGLGLELLGFPLSEQPKRK